MGMFDWIRCDYPLPDVEAQGLEFQTKDLDSLCEQLHITQEGRLYRPVYAVREPQPDDAEKYPVFAPLYEIVGEEDTEYHGDLTFYGDGYTYWSRFTEGVLVKLQRLPEEWRGG